MLPSEHIGESTSSYTSITPNSQAAYLHTNDGNQPCIWESIDVFYSFDEPTKDITVSNNMLKKLERLSQAYREFLFLLCRGMWRSSKG
jgi:hypothetical protein